MPDPIRVLITGAAGAFAYPLLYMIASGDVFGPKQPLILQLMELPEVADRLNGLVMELIDCAFPSIHQIIQSCDPAIAFTDVAAAFLCAGRPRREGEFRRDLIKANIVTFSEQGKNLDKYALKDVKVLALGNPCHTNALICSLHAPSIPKENFTSISRLDLNRTYAQLAIKLDMPVSAIKNVIVWGNHSAAVYPDISHASCMMGRIRKRLSEVLTIQGDDSYARSKLIEIVATRGTAILQARKQTSAMSAAKAACDHMRDWWHGTPMGQFTCMGVMSDGSYGATKDLIFSFPVEIKNKSWTIVKGMKIDDFCRQKIEASNKELMQERIDAMGAQHKSLHRGSLFSMRHGYIGHRSWMHSTDTGVFKTAVSMTPYENRDNETLPLDVPPRDETPKDETPKNDTPKDETPMNDTPKDDTPKDETPDDKTTHDKTSHDTPQSKHKDN